MRVALVSDIHGNLIALEALLADLTRQAVDQVVCLGDAAAFGPQPRQVIERLAELDWPTVMGNGDAWLLDPQPYPQRDEHSFRYTEIDQWCAGQLTEADLAYLQSFRPTVALPLSASDNLLCYHGSPRSYHEVIVAGTPDETLAEYFNEQEETVMAGGHSHAQLLRRFRQSLVVNPGSVGMPYEKLAGNTVRHPPWAEYALVEWRQDSAAVTLRRVPYDVAALIAVAKESGMPHLAWWLTKWEIRPVYNQRKAR